MKLRNQLLALFCFLVFIAFGVLFFRTWVVQKPFGVIVFLSDGLSTNTLTAARIYEGGADQRLNVERLPRLALVNNDSNDFAIPDEAASATAIATGVKGNNRAIAVDPKGNSLESLLALARQSGRRTGIVTTGNLTTPSTAAFYAHTTEESDVAAIAEQFMGAAGIDVALGGGLNAFTPESKGGSRKDGRDLWLELRAHGYTLLRNKAELENTPAFLTGPLIGLFADEELPYSTDVASASQAPALSDMVRRAIEFLQTNRRGYVLVVDCALISKAASENQAEKVLTETIDFDRALQTAQRYAGDKTLIIAVGKQDIGGLSLNGFPLRNDHGVALLGKNPEGQPAMTWSTGPNGPAPAPTPNLSGDGDAVAQAQAPAGESATVGAGAESKGKPEPAAYRSDKAIPTARDMIMVGSGPGSEAIHGFMDNTEVFEIVKKAL